MIRFARVWGKCALVVFLTVPAVFAGNIDPFYASLDSLRAVQDKKDGLEDLLSQVMDKQGFKISVGLKGNDMFNLIGDSESGMTEFVMAVTDSLIEQWIAVVAPSRATENLYRIRKLQFRVQDGKSLALQLKPGFWQKAALHLTLRIDKADLELEGEARWNRIDQIVANVTRLLWTYYTPPQLPYGAPMPKVSKRFPLE